MKQDVSSNEIVDELKKKVLELRYTIDKKDGDQEVSESVESCWR